MREDCAWISEGDLKLQMEVNFISNFGICSHIGKAATESIIRKNIQLGSLQEDLDDFVYSYIYCIISQTGEVVCNGSALHGKSPNEIVYIDFLYMGLDIDDLKYVLVVKDDLSGFYGLVLRVTPLETLQLFGSDKRSARSVRNREIIRGKYSVRSSPQLIIEAPPSMPRNNLRLALHE